MQELSKLESKVLELTKERDQLSERLIGLASSEQMKEDLISTRSRLELVTFELEDLRRRSAEMESELAQQTSIAKYAQSRYEIEVMRCGEVTKTILELRKQVSSLTREKFELQELNRSHESQSQGSKKRSEEVLDQLTALKEQLSTVEVENRALHEQVGSSVKTVNLAI